MNTAFYKYLVLTLFLSSGFLNNSIAQPGLKESIVELSQNIRLVKTSGNQYEQSLKYKESQPWKLSLTILIIDKKGESEENTYEFNLADIDKNTIRYEIKKDVINVHLQTKKQQKFIKVLENGQLSKYDNKFSIKAYDIDNGKELVKLIKKAVNIAKESNADTPTDGSYTQGALWLQNNIVSVNIDKKIIEQSWTSDPNNDLRFSLSNIQEGKKGTKTKVWSFNLADFSEHTLNLEIKGKTVLISAKTKGSQKYINTWNDGEKTKYVNEIEVYLQEIDQGRAMLSILESMVKDASEKVKSENSTASSLTNSLNVLSKLVNNIEDKDSSLEQILSSNCQSTFTIKETTAKGSTENEYMFHWGDIRPSSLGIKVSGKEIKLSLATNSKEKLIESFENGKARNYINKFEFTASGIENMRNLRTTIPIIIEYCTLELEKELSSINENTDGLNKMFFDKIGYKPDSEGSIEQSLKTLDNECKWGLKRITSDNKGSIEKLWEFNNSDLNPRSVKFNISKSEVFVEVSTQYAADIIKYYKDGEPGKYSSEISIWVSNIEEGRKLISLWKTIINSCKK